MIIKSKKQFKILNIILFICLYLLFLITTNHKIMAMKNNDNILNELIELNKKLNESLEEQSQIIAKVVNPEFHDEIMTEAFDNKVRLNSNSIDELRTRIHVLSERRIIDERMNNFINIRNNLIIQIITSEGDNFAENIKELIKINRQVSCVNQKEARLKHFIETYKINH
ncbi:hypothetical protein CWO85_02740 [Candidatus Phytoplasma ziziphi]|uniref:Sequence-variable mosaic (SVM) signal sequence domain-containing protein n=1 Tax=Ziziphus jujuba witches'-broom phytoplasma TaxID=135727 RepID=A0A660HN09_ZIZJU|nr:SVM family protein [Candidatus Phytoplasma ziziphi]AYJ01405.1 hypothetical protein CWO85_02740 [Candidatus Phytoplasma ziziphi]